MACRSGIARSAPPRIPKASGFWRNWSFGRCRLSLFQCCPVPVWRPSRRILWHQGEERLWAAAMRHLMAKKVDDVAAGDVLLFRMRNGAVAKYLGLQGRLGENPSFIHAYSGNGVVESPLSAPWRRRIVARFAFPEGDN